jgi:hypothetical protein
MAISAYGSFLEGSWKERLYVFSHRIFYKIMTWSDTKLKRSRKGMPYNFLLRACRNSSYKLNCRILGLQP